MDAALSSSFLASSLSNLRTKSSRSFRPAPRLNYFLYNPLSRSSSVSLPSSRGGSISRKLYQVRATSLKEKDEKVMVEESFQAKTLLETERKEMDAELSGNESGIVERWVIKFEQSVNVLLTDSVIKILDALYRDRHYARFFVLETIARVPYFAFISVLHMYESFGWWRRVDYLKVHFAETWNELHHLLIMEELGGNALWFDRFLAQHIAIFYYFMTAFMYILSPRMAYHFSECVEKHAYSTYDKFLKLQGVYQESSNGSFGFVRGLDMRTCLYSPEQTLFCSGKSTLERLLSIIAGDDFTSSGLLASVVLKGNSRVTYQKSTIMLEV